MLPRYGKNYALIPKLAPGPMEIEILFQQNIYPPVRFNILVPENGCRAFLVSRKGELCFLYDLQQNFSLKPGNELSEDHLPQVITSTQPANSFELKTDVTGSAGQVKSEEKIQEEIPLTPSIVPDSPASAGTGRAGEGKVPAESTTVAGIAKPEATSRTAPLFIDDIELSKGKEELAATTGIEGETGTPAIKKEVIVNSDCPEPMSDREFQRLYKAVINKESEEERLGVLLGYKKACYTVQMAVVLGQCMRTDAAKYTVFKNLYPRITNQAEFARLENQFATEEWKEYFKKLPGQIPPSR